MAHVDKYNRNNITGLVIHYERKEGCELSNKEIDKTRTHLNYNLAAQIQPLKPEKYISKRLDEVKHINRKDIIVMADWIVTLPKDVLDDDKDKFFEHVFQFMKEEYGEKNIVSAWVHNDETTPHIHVGFMPVIDDEGIERLNCKKLITKTYLKTFHNRLSYYLENKLGYKCEILNGATVNGNRTIKELKNQEDICLGKAKQNIMDSIAVSKELAKDAENIEFNGSFISKMKSLPKANKAIEDLTKSNKDLSLDNYRLIKVIDVQKKELDMYREMPLAKQLKKKDETINNLYSSINDLHNDIDNQEFKYMKLQKENKQLYKKQDELMIDNKIYKLFIDTFNLGNIFKQFKSHLIYNNFSLKIGQLKDLCTSIIKSVTSLFNIYNRKDDQGIIHIGTKNNKQKYR
ncbi:MAG: plasmid recombination protein [Erysipelotrichaceae bacterium]|nr:plasmid recombination protein [Erysipelotrichaceae bacterium]